MKKRIIIGLGIIGLVILGIIGFCFLSYEPGLKIKDNNADIFCQDYDKNEQGCLLHEECEWISNEDICDKIGSVEEDNYNNDKRSNEEEFEYVEIYKKLELIEVPNNPSNKLCKQLPLSGHQPYGERYYCLAIVNNDERFCEGIDEEKSRNICLAHAKEDPSYCKKLQEDSSKRVCYYMLAVHSEEGNFCSEIDYSQHEKEQCYFNFMSNLYQWNRSEEIKVEHCEQLGSPDDNTCLALKARDISMCGDNPNCLTFFEQPLSFCDEHPDFVSCMKDRAKTSKDVSICELLSQPDRDICIGVYCTHTELEVTICDTIESIEERQDRYVELAMDLANLR